MTPGASWVLLLVIVGLFVGGVLAVMWSLASQEEAANEPLEEPGWRELRAEPTTVRTIPAPYDRTQEANPI
jgi:flagellar basal body-associated protein FliL